MIRRTLLLLLIAASVASAERVYLRDGTMLEGTIVSMENGDFVLEKRSYWGAERMLVSRKEISRIEFDTAPPPPMPPPPEGSTWLDDARHMRQKTFEVPSTIPWTATGIWIERGARIYFNAENKIEFNKKSEKWATPAGEDDSPYNPSRPLPREGTGALIGKLGEGTTNIFLIGAEHGPFTAPVSGQLYLGVNDDYLLDNYGNFRVTIYY